MKFSEWKSYFNESNASDRLFVVVIDGEDAYLRASALETLRKKLNFSFEDLNAVSYGEETRFDDILAACRVLPFLDVRRLVTVKNYPLEKYPAALEKLQEYCRNPVKETLLVLSFDGARPFLKTLFESGAVEVDCRKLDLPILIKWISAVCQRAGKRISAVAAQTICEYCLRDMSRIDSETRKLIAYETGEEITLEDVHLLVNRDVEFQVYDLANAVALKQTDRALQIVETLLADRQDASMLVGSVYGTFRRMFYVSVSQLSQKELGSFLKVKDYAIVKARESAQNFKPIALKKALDLCAAADFDLKSGRLRAEDALRVLVLQLLHLA